MKAYFHRNEYGDVEFHDTLDAAKRAAQSAFDDCRREVVVGGDWADGSEQICYGSVIGQVIQTREPPIQSPDPQWDKGDDPDRMELWHGPLRSIASAERAAA